jgi:hypothetical protein
MHHQKTISIRRHIIVSTLFAALGLILFSGCTPTRFTVSFDQVNGLKKADPVICDSSPVGQVKKITYTEDGKFLVSLEIDSGFSDCTTEHARFFIGSAPEGSGVKAVLIEKGPAGGKQIARNAVVEGSRKSPAEAAAASLDELRQTLEKKVANLMSQLETIPETDEYQALKDAMAELEQKLKESGQKMGDTLKNDLLPLLEEKIKALSESLRQQGEENKADSLEKDFGRLQDF